MTDAADLREFMLRIYETDYGASDEALQAQADRAKEYIAFMGYRWSWKSIAADQIRVTALGPERGF